MESSLPEIWSSLELCFKEETETPTIRIIAIKIANTEKVIFACRFAYGKQCSLA
jgi:hypothetical protein